MRNYVKTFNKSFPTFVSKYRGRSNGGIPCFSQERSRERELKVSEVDTRWQHLRSGLSFSFLVFSGSNNPESYTWHNVLSNVQYD